MLNVHTRTGRGLEGAQGEARQGPQEEVRRAINASAAWSCSRRCSRASLLEIE
jgi:hypothetical protein